MLFGLFRWLVFAIFLAGLTLWMIHNPGSVTVEWFHWRLETSASFFAIAIGLLALFGLWLFHVIRCLFSIPTLTKQWMQKRKSKEGFQALGKAYAAHLTEDIDTFQKEALRAKTLLKNEPVALLAATQAILSTGCSATAQPLLSALSETEYTRSPVLKLLADTAEKEENYTEQKRLAQEAYALTPRPTWTLSTLVTCHIRDKNWEDAAEKAQELLKSTPHHPRQAYMSSACWAACAEHDLERDDSASAVRHARKALNVASDFIPALVVAIRSFQRNRSVDKASSLIAETWPKMPHPALTDCFFDLYVTEDALKIASRVKKITDTAPDHPESRIFLARAALKAQLWGQARAALAPLCEQENARAADLMAHIEDGDRGSAEVVSMWLRRAVEWQKTDPDQEKDALCSAQAWLFEYCVPRTDMLQHKGLLPGQRSPRPILQDLRKRISVA